MLAVGMISLPLISKKIARVALDLLFPPACLGCGIEIAVGHSDGFFCPSCLDQLIGYVGPVCSRCGKPIPAIGVTEEEGCFRCVGSQWHFDETIAMGPYDGLLRELILRMKKQRDDPLSLAVGAELWDRCQDRLAGVCPDVVVPIPMHWQRRWEYRTNSAEILAEVLSRRLRAPLATRLLRRRRNTHPQFSLSPRQRMQNVRRAFSVRTGYHLRGAHILLVDDILTTGATCSEASKTLKFAGAAHVTVVVAARSTFA